MNAHETTPQSGGSAVSRRAFLGAAMMGAVGAARPRLTRGSMIAIMGGGKPLPYDQELKYIKLKGEWKFEIGKPSTADGFVLSTRLTVHEKIKNNVFFTSDKWTGFGSTGNMVVAQKQKVGFAIGEEYLIEIRDERFHLNGVDIGENRIDKDYNLIFLGFSVPGYDFEGDVGRSRIEIAGEKAFDWVPCVKDGEVGFWDFVSMSLISDPSFVAGPVSGYHKTT